MGRGARHVLFVVVCAAHAAHAAADDACFPGITVQGLGKLDGDYMKNPVGWPNTAYFQGGIGKQVVRNAITYGCGDETYKECSEEDTKKYAGKWIIREFMTADEPEIGCSADIGKPCRVLAVC